MIELVLQSDTQAKNIFDMDMHRDFPENEIKPWEVPLTLYRKGEYAFLAAYDGGCLVGYIWVYVPMQGAVLLDYFAVLPQFRGAGMGSRILDALKGRYGIFVLESELPDSAPSREIAERRLRFYERNGMMDTGLRVILFGVTFCILSSEKIHAREEMTAIYRGLLGEETCAKAVTIL